MQEDLHLSNFLGGLLAPVFLIGYFSTSPVFGTLADRATRGGRSRLIALGIAIWSAATVGSGLASSTATLLWSRALVGVGEASYATIAPTLIDDLAPPDRKGRWLAVFYAAMPVGSALGYVVGGAVEHATHSWRSAFFLAGGPGILLALLSLLIAEPARTASGAKPNVASAAAVWWTLLNLRRYRATVLGYCAYTFAIGGFAFWAPKYLHVHYGLETGRGSMIFGAITVVAGGTGTLLGGWLGDRFQRGSLRRRRGRRSQPPGLHAVGRTGSALGGCRDPRTYGPGVFPCGDTLRGGPLSHEWPRRRRGPPDSTPSGAGARHRSLHFPDSRPRRPMVPTPHRPRGGPFPYLCSDAFRAGGLRARRRHVAAWGRPTTGRAGRLTWATALRYGSLCSLRVAQRKKIALPAHSRCVPFA